MQLMVQSWARMLMVIATHSTTSTVEVSLQQAYRVVARPMINWLANRVAAGEGYGVPVSWVHCLRQGPCRR